MAHTRTSPQRLRRGLVAAVALAVLAAPAAASAESGTVTLFPTPTADAQPFGIAPGPDGNVWFTEKQSAKPIGRITPDGQITEFATEAGGTAENITTGPDGNLWFTGGTKVGRITPDGTYTGFAGLVQSGRGIATGPDGNLWIVDPNANKIVGVKPDGTAASDVLIPTAGSNPQQIVAGPDGNMWFTETDKVGRLNMGVTPHTIDEFPIGAGSGARGIAVGPDGRIWFAESNLKKIGRIAVDGTGFEESGTTIAPTSDPEGLAFGRDGNLWISIFNGRAIGRMAPDFALNQYSAGAPADMGPRYIARGADGNMWFTDETHSAIGRVTVDPPPTTTTPTTPTTTTPTPTDTVRPVVSQLRLSAKTFVPGAKPTATSAGKRARRPVGTTISYRVSERATVTLSLQRAATGRRQGGTCRKPSRANRGGKRCTRYVAVGALTRASVAGTNRVPFTGRVGKRKLPAGAYRLSATARDAAGNATRRVVTARFTIARTR